MRDGYWVIRTYKAGHVEEKIKYWIPGERPSRSARRQRASIKKVQQNEAQASKRLARLINANFDKQDKFVTLTYSTEGLTELIARIESRGIDIYSIDEKERMLLMRKEAEREFNNALRRIKRTLKDDELKYVAVTSDLDGEKEETVRIHHHLVINGEALSAFLEKWTAGAVEYEDLFDEADHTALAAYMINQVRYVQDEKKYSRSRNLITPQPVDKIATNGAELRVPAKCELLYRAEYKPGMPQYIRYIRHKAAKTDKPEEDTEVIT